MNNDQLTPSPITEEWMDNNSTVKCEECRHPVGEHIYPERPNELKCDVDYCGCSGLKLPSPIAPVQPPSPMTDEEFVRDAFEGKLVFATNSGRVILMDGLPQVILGDNWAEARENVHAMVLAGQLLKESRAAKASPVQPSAVPVDSETCVHGRQSKVCPVCTSLASGICDKCNHYKRHCICGQPNGKPIVGQEPDAETTVQPVQGCRFKFELDRLRVEVDKGEFSNGQFLIRKEELSGIRTMFYLAQNVIPYENDSLRKAIAEWLNDNPEEKFK